jgi:hypothetical protein
MDNQVTCPLCGTTVKADDNAHLKAQHQATTPDMTNTDVNLAQHMMKLEQRIKELENH